MRTILSQVLIAALSLLPGAAAAENVMTWIDADGVRHFSQSPPTGPVRQLKTLELEPAEPAGEPDPARLDVIREVARELEAARRAREAVRAPLRPAISPPRAPPPERVFVVPAIPYGGAPPLRPRPLRPPPHDARDRDHRIPEDAERPRRRPPARVLPDV